MHVEQRLSEELIEEYHGGHATIFRTEHKGRQVAVKVVRIYLTSNFGKCFSVSILTVFSSEVPIDHWVYRTSVGRLLRGDTSVTRTSCRCSVWTWNGIGLL